MSLPFVVQATSMTKHIPESGEARYCVVYEYFFAVLNDHSNKQHLLFQLNWTSNYCAQQLGWN